MIEDVVAFLLQDETNWLLPSALVEKRSIENECCSVEIITQICREFYGIYCFFKLLFFNMYHIKDKLTWQSGLNSLIVFIYLTGYY